MKHTIAEVQRVQEEFMTADKKIHLFNNSYQNFKKYQIPKAQLIISDIPFNLSVNAYASNPMWYEGGDNKNGESELAGEEFFDTDKNFKPAEFIHFCSQMLKPEPKDKTKTGGVRNQTAPCMILFCAFEQMQYFIELGARYGLKRYIPLVFRKNYSPSVLKANMRVVCNCEYGLILYRDKLPKFNNDGKMIMNCMDYVRDTTTRKIHPTQKSIPLLGQLISLFTDPDDVVIDPCAGSGTTLIAAGNLGRKAYGFEIKKNFYADACGLINEAYNPDMFVKEEERRRKAERMRNAQVKNMFPE